MSKHDVVEFLLSKWDEQRERGNEVSAEMLCETSPDLLPELKFRIAQLKAMDWLDKPALDADGVARKIETNESRNSPFGEKKVPALIGGRYQMQSLMAEGGFGQVWRAIDLSLLRPVAVKVTTLNCFAEARRVAQLKHHGIVTVHDVGNADNMCYIVFDLVEGITLAEKIRLGTLTWQQSVQIVADVALSVQFAHDKGFIHRDLKPSNVLLAENDLPVLADFGIAVTECELKQESMTSLGTLAYMAPEQLQTGQAIDARTDVYGLGVVLYELLTGKLPFFHQTLSRLRERILRGDPPSPRTGNATIPEEIERICLKALSTRQDDRFPSARVFSETLKQQLTRETDPEIG